MSLVERALARMRMGEAAKDVPVKSGPVGQLREPDPELPAPDAVAPVAVSPPRRRQVTVDLDAVRAAGLLAPGSQERSIAQEYRHIKRPLLAEARALRERGMDHHNLFMIGSAFSGEGKSFTCVNLAMSLSLEKDISVLLVDADVIKPTISRLFGVDAQPGLLDSLRDPSLDIESLIVETDVPRLQVLSAGMSDEHATELLSSQRMREVAAAVARNDPTRMVLFDSPPLLQTTEARALASIAGQVVLVVAANRTPQTAVLEAIELLGPQASPKLVLNRAERSAIGSYYYGYGYGYHDSAAAAGRTDGQ